MWKTYVEGYYEVHPEGFIRSLDRYVLRAGHPCHIKGLLMRPSNTAAGYPKVTIWIEGVKVYKALHRIIAETFLERPAGCDSVNHKDGDKQNNHVDNLEWCSAGQNNRHALDTGLRRRTKDTVCAVLNETDVHIIRTLLLDTMTDKEIAKEFEVHPATIYSLRHNKTWKIAEDE